MNTQTELLIYVWALGIFFEILTIIISNRLIRRILYSLIIISLSFLITSTFIYDPVLIVGIICIIGLFRLFNGFRVITERINKVRLLRVSKRTSLVLVISQILVTTFWAFNINISGVLILIALFSVFIGLLLLLSTKRNLKKAKTVVNLEYISDKDLPSISVCIPARNETSQLSTCLDHVLKSDYPKLEILVLDDCSQDKTSEIIKGYAHSGVRFIPGEITQAGWLAKNQAYASLAESASSEIIIFCGVDVRFGKNSLRTLVANIINKNKKMISVLPKSAPSGPNSRLLQPMRYWWELVLPRRLFNRPPVLSTVWAINKKTFKSLGGMKSVKNSVMPEGYFAREILKKDGYSFMISSGDMEIGSSKPLADQLQTSIRTRYPRLKNRPENVLAISFLEYMFLLGPFIIFVNSYINKDDVLLIISLVNILLLISVHYMVIRAWGAKNTITTTLLLPLAIITEVIVTIVSMWRYEFGEVKWKDRDICIPVMKNYPKLPKT